MGVSQVQLRWGAVNSDDCADGDCSDGNSQTGVTHIVNPEWKFRPSEAKDVPGSYFKTGQYDHHYPGIHGDYMRATFTMEVI